MKHYSIVLYACLLISSPLHMHGATQTSGALSFSLRLLLFTTIKECTQRPLSPLKKRGICYSILASYIPYVAAYATQYLYDYYTPKVKKLIIQKIVHKTWDNDYFDTNTDFLEY